MFQNNQNTTQQLSAQPLFVLNEQNMPQFVELMFERWEQSRVKSTKPKMMCTKQVKVALLAKGFHCNSTVAFINLVQNLNLTRQKMGREFWYVTEEVEAVSPRTLNS